MLSESAKAVRIGASGWHYKHWIGPFYPPRLSAAKMLSYYLQQFDTVELNNTFYRLPAPTAVERWRDDTPAGFCFAAKGSRFLTHMKKLKDPAPGIEKFFSRIEPLGEKLGPIVFQLPPRWGFDVERLRIFLEALPSYHRYSFEFRDQSWHTAEVVGLLEKHRAALCIYDLAGFQSPIEVTTDLVYVRLHGPGGKYQGSYDDTALQKWAERVRTWRDQGRSVYVYFDNDQAAFAVNNALTLRRLTC